MVSVIMGVYNTPYSFFKSAIDSIINQTYTDFELLIIDDYSCDKESIEYLYDFENYDERIRVIHNSRNLGLTHTLNIGLGLCKGEYIARMDSDDISLPDRMERQVEFLEQHIDVALVGSNKITFGDGLIEHDGSLDRNRCDDPEIYRIRSLIQHSGPAHPSFMFRASFLKEHNIKYREDILKAQDYGIMVDILKNGGKIHKIKGSLIKYRMHSNQISATSEIEQKLYQSRVSYDYIKYLFPELSDSESAAISMLGNDYSIEKLVCTVKEKETLKTTCFHIVDNEEDLKNGNTYVLALKKIISLNKQKMIYDPTLFETELRAEWWNRVRETYKNQHEIMGLTPYTIFSHKYAFVVRKSL